MKPSDDLAVKGTTAIGAATAGTGAALSAAIASACCVGPSIAPFLISVIGASGAIALTYLRPFAPALLAASALGIAFSFRQVYRKQACAPDAPVPRMIRVARIVTWLAAAMWVASLANSIYGFLHE